MLSTFLEFILRQTIHKYFLNSVFLVKLYCVNLVFLTKMQSLASSPHLTQPLDPTHHSVIEPNPTHGWIQPMSISAECATVWWMTL